MQNQNAETSEIRNSFLRNVAIWELTPYGLAPRYERFQRTCSLIRKSLFLHILFKTETSPYKVTSGNDWIVLGKSIGSNLGHVTYYLTTYISPSNSKKNHSST
jgi:hypothetical protein